MTKITFLVEILGKVTKINFELKMLKLLENHVKTKTLGGCGFLFFVFFFVFFFFFIWVWLRTYEIRKYFMTFHDTDKRNLLKIKYIQGLDTR